MKRNKYILLFFFWTLFLGLTACYNNSSEKMIPKKSTSDKTLIESKPINSVTKEHLTKIYSQAIKEFINAAYKNTKTTFDTLYFGKRANGQPDDFPNIELPEKIENVQLQLVSQELGKKIFTENKNRHYINLIGFVEKESAEFIFVVFSDGFTHNYDYYINFKNSSTSTDFELDKIDFENYLQLNGKKAKRISIYKDGDYVADK